MCVEQLFNIRTCFGANGLKHGTVTSDDNPFMRIPFTVDCCMDLCQSVTDLFNPHDLDTNPVRNFIMKVPQCFFTDDLGTDDTFRLVRHHIIREVFRSFRKVSHDTPDQVLHSGIFPCAYRDNIIETRISKLSCCSKNSFRVNQVDLVQCQNLWHLVFADIGSKPEIVVLNKKDLSDKAETDAWISKLTAGNVTAIPCDCENGAGTARLMEELARANEKRNSTKKWDRPLRMMIVGVPNVGKSSLINRLTKRKAAKTGDRPGVTKGKQWMTLENGMQLLGIEVPERM